MQEFVSAGRQLNVVAKRMSYYDIVFVFDILEKYERDCASTFKELSKEVDLGEVTKMISAFRLTALKTFHDFIEDVEGKKETSASVPLSNDGTVHETTSNVSRWL